MLRNLNIIKFSKILKPKVNFTSINYNFLSKSSIPIGYGHDLLSNDEMIESYRKKSHKLYNQGLPGIGKVK